MAILKSVVNKNIKPSKPEALCELPKETAHQAGPEPFEHKCCPPPAHIHLCASFDDAVIVCSQIYLKPGETHTEFYKDESGKYHCVIAVGNINAGAGHLYLSDSGMEASISDQLASVNAKISNVNVLINEILAALEQFNETLDNHTVSIEEIQTDIESIESQLEILNAFKAEVAAYMQAHKPIADEDIKSLFHSPFEDAYTVNLCCYTAAGHVEVYDYPADYKDRVADCTPANEYKTYNAGNRIKFVAVENEGYRFDCWLKDGKKIAGSTNVLETEFEDEDINVIGTLNDGYSGDNFERAPLTNGYTALYKKRLKMTWNKVVTTKDAELFNDKLTIRINGSIAIGNSAYFEAGDRIEIVARAGEHHEFLTLEINGDALLSSSVVIADAPNYNLNIIAYFKEIRYTIRGFEEPALSGNVKTTAKASTVLEGSVVTLTAVANEGYKFVNWTLDDEDPWYSDPEHSGWTSESNPLTFKAGEDSNNKSWIVVANFREVAEYDLTLTIQNGQMLINEQLNN